MWALRLITPMVVLTLMFSASTLYGGELTRQSLFRIERNTNDNIIQYDAQIGHDGKLDPREPVVAYWIRLAEEGQVKKLSFVQRKFAYGFKARYNARDDTAEIKMAAEIGRLITVRRVRDHFRALTNIDGKLSHIDTIFIHANGKGMSTRVEYIELRGIDAETGDDRYERFIP
jgi:hypothetical protein